MNIGRKLLSLGGMLMIGDGLAQVLGQERHLEAWRLGGRRYGRVLDWFEKHSLLCSGLALGELIAGAALVRRAETR
jgi:hypothetical protein